MNSIAEEATVEPVALMAWLDAALAPRASSSVSSPTFQKRPKTGRKNRGDSSASMIRIGKNVNFPASGRDTIARFD